MLLVNISSDYVQLLDDTYEEYLERNGIEKTLGTTLLAYVRHHPVDTILLLNGPGGFTNLRVGTLTINMLNTLLQHDTQTFIPIASISKIALYTYAYEHNMLPRYGIIYIGQKHNVRKYDFAEQTYVQIQREEITLTDDTFLDRVHDSYRAHDAQMISFSMENSTFYLQYQGQSHQILLADLEISLTMTVQPEYFIQPTMN